MVAFLLRHFGPRPNPPPPGTGARDRLPAPAPAPRHPHPPRRHPAARAPLRAGGGQRRGHVRGGVLLRVCGLAALGCGGGGCGCGCAQWVHLRRSFLAACRAWLSQLCCNDVQWACHALTRVFLCGFACEMTWRPTPYLDTIAARFPPSSLGPRPCWKRPPVLLSACYPVWIPAPAANPSYIGLRQACDLELAGEKINPLPSSEPPPKKERWPPLRATAWTPRPGPSVG